MIPTCHFWLSGFFVVIQMDEHLRSKRFTIKGMSTNNSSLSYHEKLAQADREARLTLLAACFVTILFWLAIFLAQDALVAWFGIPLWFWLSCIGGYLLSVIAVIVLVRFGCKNFDLQDVSDGERQ